MSATHVLAFAAVAAVIVAVPGPSLLFTIGRALTVGRRPALFTVLGNGLGLLVQVAFVAAGLGAVLAASATAYLVVKLLGALFATMAVVGDSTWALAAGRARAWFGRRPRRLEAVGGAGGVMMIGLGVTVALTGRPD